MIRLSGDKPNFRCLHLSGLLIWFSYETPIAFQAMGSMIRVSENCWGPTTGKHLNSLTPAKWRVKRQEFERQLEAALGLACLNLALGKSKEA